jgi:SAM-dependent methyltransferase
MKTLQANAPALVVAIASVAAQAPPQASTPAPQQRVPDNARRVTPDEASVQAQRERWNNVFSAPRANIRTDANAFLVQVANELKPGVAIDIGMGVGRNALYLARHGWKVTGVDVSDVGVQKAREQAEAEKLPLTAVREDMFKFDYGHDRYDLVVFTYMGGERSGMADKITDALKPGGLLVIEHFLQTADEKLGYPAGVLPTLYPKLEVLRYAEVDGRPDYGQQTPEKVVQFLARKHP